jgi:hypothetical protein
VKRGPLASLHDRGVVGAPLARHRTADFDGDGTPDLGIPIFDRRSLRLIAFGPSERDI